MTALQSTRSDVSNVPAQLRFAAGARERFAGTFFDQQFPLGAASVNLPQIDIAAGDYTAGVYVHCTATTAANAAATTFAADGPFSVIQQIELLDPQGVAFQTLSGWELALMDVLGGWTGQGDPLLAPEYLATTGAGATGGSFGFILRIPAELFPRDAAGALFNGSTAAQFKIRITQAPSTQVYGVAPTALPNVRYRVNSHGYQVPNPVALNNVPYAAEPPGGQIYQNLYRQVYQIAGAGNIIVPLVRKGFLIRGVAIIVRDNTGARSNTVLAGDWNILFDNVNVFNGTYDLFRRITWERNKWPAAANVPTGVVQLSYAFDGDGTNGGESRDQYVPTQPGSILELRAVAAAAGSVTIITNDVAPSKAAAGIGVVKV
jgi:hypothetical protein